MRRRLWVRPRRGVAGRRPLALVALAAALLLPAAAAQAQLRGPCGQEIGKLCPELRPGTAEFRACFEEHKHELSPMCRERLAQGRERLDQMRNACASDIEAHCGDIQRGGGKLMRCLNEHVEELSDGCRESLPRRGRMRRAPAKATVQQPAPTKPVGAEAEAQAAED
jgi:hypothetical protein